LEQAMFEGNIPAALSWMIEQGMVVRRTTKDPETFIPIQGYILSDELREEIGSNLVKLFSKATKRSALRDVTIADAFVTATIAALIATAEAQLSQEEMTMCTNIILKLLPFGKLESAGITGKTLRQLSRDRTLLRRLRETCSPGGEGGF
jgi:sensor c-di-GMP phosphodiesterase-like protein